MGMIGYLRAITPDELKAFQARPSTIQGFILQRRAANAAEVQEALARVQDITLKAIASGEFKDPKKQEEIRARILQELQAAGVTMPGEGPGEHGLRLEKSWHSLHYLLTGSAAEVKSSLGNAILGGKKIGPDLGFGPARFLDPGQVREVAAALSTVSKEDLARRFDLEAMTKANIYACEDESELELAQHYFEQVVRYYTDAAQRGDGMLLYIV